MELTDVQPVEKWMELEQDLVDRYQFQASVFNSEGVRITTSKSWANRLCPEIKGLEKGQTFICAVAHMNMANQARSTKEAVIEECDAGLLKLMVPVFWQEDFMGVVGGCGLLAQDGEVDSFSINKLTDMAEADIESLSAGIAVMPEDTAKEACDYIRSRIDQTLAACSRA